MHTIHNRMPVILPRADYARWLAPVDASWLPIDLLRPSNKEMAAWR
ncbi:SOS response-associated peptidase family protein [Tunturiibacter gelidiferens]